MNKLRIIIRLYHERVGLRPISAMSRTSRTTVKKYIDRWNALGMSYSAFQQQSDSQLNALFSARDQPMLSAKQRDLEDRLPNGIPNFTRTRGWGIC